jgi:hypothetical protein
VPFELGQSGQHGQDQATVRRRGVAPCILQRTKACAALTDGVEQVQQIARRSRQSIEPTDQQRVTWFEPTDHLAQFRPIGLCAGCRFLEDLGGTGLQGDD